MWNEWSTKRVRVGRRRRPMRERDVWVARGAAVCHRRLREIARLQHDAQVGPRRRAKQVLGVVDEGSIHPIAARRALLPLAHDRVTPEGKRGRAGK